MDKHERIADRKKRLANLANHPDWKILVAIFEDRAEKQKKRIGAMVLAREDHKVVQREIDYIAGYQDAVNHILATPQLAEVTLQAALDKADEMKELKSVA